MTQPIRTFATLAEILRSNTKPPKSVEDEPDITDANDDEIKKKKAKPKDDQDPDDEGDKSDIDDTEPDEPKRKSLAQQIVRAGAIRRGEIVLTSVTQPRSQPVTATAAAIIAAGKRRRGEA